MCRCGLKKRNHQKEWRNYGATGNTDQKATIPEPVTVAGVY